MNIKKFSYIMLPLIALAIAVTVWQKVSSDSTENSDLPEFVMGKKLMTTNKPLVCTEGMLVEVFAYQCPHCWKLEKFQDLLIANSTNFLKVPTDLGNPKFRPYIKLHHAIDMLKMDSSLKHEAMRLYHEDAVRFASENSAIAWLGQHGANPIEAKTAFDSDKMAARIGLGNSILKDGGIKGVPTIIVNGRYQTSPYLAGGYDKLEAHIKELKKLPHSCRTGKA